MYVSALFDKSFLQSINLDEAVWFDQYFRTIICPVFYIETLADLAKVDTGDRKPESIVKWLADKAPQMHSYPCVAHMDLATRNLLGYPVAMDGRVLMPGGRPVNHKGRIDVVYEESRESAAFSRWQDERYDELDRLYASQWRREIESIDLKGLAKEIKGLGVRREHFGSIEEVRDAAVAAITTKDNRPTQLVMASLVLALSKRNEQQVFQRWEMAGNGSAVRSEMLSPESVLCFVVAHSGNISSWSALHQGEVSSDFFRAASLRLSQSTE